MLELVVSPLANMQLTTLAYIFLILIIWPTNAQRDVDCKWRENLTDVEDLPHHKYTVLEDCLYYFLSKQADKSQGKASALLLLPPTRYGPRSDRLQVGVAKTVIRQMWMNEVWKEMHVNGYMAVSWRDYRLKWTPADWKIDNMKIKTYGHLWMPDIYSERYQTSVQSSDFTTYQHIRVSNTGNVSARLEYRMQATCDVDYSNYPADKKTCCFNLKSYLFPWLIQFKLGSSKVDTSDLKTNWKIEDLSLTKKTDEDTGGDYMSLCLTAGRKSSTLKIELTVPMIISALLVIVAPLFGQFRHQLYVKMFAILLQFLCFQYLVNKTPHIGFGDSIPKIYKFYEFTLAITVISLLCTLVIWSVSRAQRSLPPPHSLMLAASVFNSKLCCAEEIADKQESGTDYSKDWKQIFAALNNALSIVILFVYVIGVIVLCT